MEVEEGAEVVVEVGVDLGDEGVGAADMAQPLADAAAVLGLDQCVVIAVAGLALAAAVPDVSGPAVLGDETVRLSPGEARHHLEESPHQPLVGLPEAVVLEADQAAAHERRRRTCGR